MAVDKGKVKAALDALFKGKSVSKELKEKYAARWAEKIETDEDIEKYVKDREDDVLDFSKEADARATAAATKARQEAADAAAGKKAEGPKEDEVPNDAPDWFKSFMQKDAAEKKALSEKLGAFEAAKTAESITDRFTKAATAAGIPLQLITRSIPKTEEEFDTTLAELTTDYAEMATTHKLQQFGNDKPGGAGVNGGNGGKVKEASKEEVNEVLAQL